MATLHLPRFQRVSRHEHPGLRAVSALMWSLAGGLVVLFVFFAALGAFDPADAVGVTIGFAAIGMLWLAHAWPRLRNRNAPSVSQRARERRGF